MIAYSRSKTILFIIPLTQILYRDGIAIVLMKRSPPMNGVGYGVSRLWLGTWQGTIDRETLTWLRFYERSGALFFLPEDAAQQRARAESQRAERLAAGAFARVGRISQQLVNN